MKKHLFLIASYLFVLTINSQEITKDYFRSPLDIPLYLSGNFGELRSNHFHAGLDIKTQGVEGQKVLAVADGYVSRIKVSPYGYGNALYITHPNGFTSVYGHLQKYNEVIAKMVKNYQYQQESFAVELFPSPFQLQVKKGDLVAYTGNTGGSGGPHLHFEIRKTANEHPYNPLFFGFDIKDEVKPDIYAVTIFPLNDSTYINGVNKKQRFMARGSNGNYYIPLKNPIRVKGEVGFGIEAVDRMSSTSNRYGLHNIQLMADSTIIFEQQIDEFAFHEGRYINAHIDYENYLKTRRRVEKSFVQEGNHLRIYKKKNGKLFFADGDKKNIAYLLSDLNGNTSKVTFEILGTKQNGKSILSQDTTVEVIYMPHNQRNTLLKDNILLDIPNGSLYENTYFKYKESPKNTKTLSPIYWLHEHTVPVHQYMSLSIKMDSIPKKLKSKALIASTTNGYNWYSEGGSWSGDNLNVKTRSFGGYAILVDTISPSIVPINIYNNANMSKKWSISIKATDYLSGIANYRGTIDGKWILMEYDAKSNRFTYFFDDQVGEGQHEFKFTVSDGVGNTAAFSANFIR